MATPQSRSNKNVLKRHAEDELEPEQRLSKRFNLLNLEHQAKLWINPKDAIYPPSLDTAPETNGNRVDDDLMQVEDTKTKIYIHNLDEELAEIDKEPQENRIIFVPDIERHLSRIPKHVLTGGEERNAPLGQPAGNELILYSVPHSLTLPPEQDTVRRVILESRARAKQGQEANRQQEAFEQMQMAEMQASGIDDQEQDDEAMDLG